MSGFTPYAGGAHYREGTRLIHTAPVGSKMTMFRGRMVVAGPSHAPYYVNTDGTTEPIADWDEMLAVAVTAERDGS